MEVKDLTRGSIGKELFLLALPLTLANIVGIAYNMIDMFFVGKLGPEAISAIGTGGLFLWLSSSIVYFSKQGMEILVSQALGRGEHSKSRDIVLTGIIINVIISLLYAGCTFIFADQLVSLFHFESIAIHNMATSYLRIVSFAIVLMMINQNLMSVFQARGMTRNVLFFNGFGLIVNIILDPLLIIHFGFGIAGAAVATLIANMIVFALAINSVVKFERSNDGKSKYDSKIGREMVRLSFPTGCYQVFFTLVAMIISTYVIRFGDNVIAAQRIGGNFESLSWMMAMGVEVASAVFTGQNVGAKNKQRIMKAYRYLAIFACVYGALLFILFITKAPSIVGFFTDDPEVIEIGTSYLYFLSAAQVFTLLEGIGGGFFNGYGYTKVASFFSISGNVIRLILVVLLSQFMGVNGVWLAISITGIYKGLGITLYRIYYERIGKLDFKLETANQ